MPGRRCGMFLLGALLFASAGHGQDASAPARPTVPRRGEPLPEPNLERVTRVFAADRSELDLATLFDKLAEVDVVFCGETHLDHVTHRLELALYEGLLQRRQSKVVLAL